MKKRLFLIITVTLFLGIILSAAIPKIFIVYSYDKDYAWNEALATSIERTLDSTACQIQSFYMDTRLKNEQQWKVKSGQMALEEMNAFDPDVVIACDDNAQQYFVSLIPPEEKTPIIFCGVNTDPSVYGYPNEKTTGILERPFPLRSLILCKQIDPEIKTVAFIGDDTNSTDGYIKFLKEQNLGDFENLGFFKYEHFDKLLEDLQILEKFANCFYFIRTTEFKDAKGNIISTQKAMEMINQVTDKPIIGLSDYIVYDGALCGVVPDPNFHGTLSAQMALQIANERKRPADFPIIAYQSNFDDLEDGLSIINLNIAHEKNIRIPVELLNKVDVVVASMERLDRIALDYYQLMAGYIMTDLYSFLNELALKPYARSGDWSLIRKDIEQRLEQIEKDHKAYNYPGIYLYIKPDGNYYSHIRNLTGENLSSRGYFHTLLNGDTVKGYPVISRSTGIKSCVFAVPAFKENQPTGFVGMSLYMEPLNHYLNQRMNLSDDTVYFALKDETMILSSDNSYLFSPVGEYINEDTGYFLSRLYEKETGNITFSHNNGLYYGLYDTQDITEWKYIYAKKIHDFSNNSSSSDMRKNLVRVTQELSQRISEMEANFLEASASFSKQVDIPQNIHSILETIYQTSPYVFDVAYVNTDLVMQYMAPKAYRHLEGTDISDQEQMQQLYQTKMPVVSQLFMTEEDLFGIDVEWPVFNKNGEWKGSLSMLIEPYEFFGQIIEKNLKNTDYEIWIMQQDGTIIYDIDRHEINENLFQEGIYSAYKELQELGRQINAQKEGQGNYTFLKTGTDISISKEAYWSTLDFHGNIWKVIITRMIE